MRCSEDVLTITNKKSASLHAKIYLSKPTHVGVVMRNRRTYLVKVIKQRN